MHGMFGIKTTMIFMRLDVEASIRDFFLFLAGSPIVWDLYPITESRFDVILAFVTNLSR